MAKSLKIAIILSGCGVYDGAEIRESVLTLLAVEQNGCTYKMFAPDIEQMHTVNHLTGEEMDQKRNVLVEAARIARGQIKPLSEFNAQKFDALMLPGGFGGAKNLSNYAVKGPDMEVNSEVEKAVKYIHALKKPIGSICITPVIISKVLGNVEVTLGHDNPSVEHVEALGAKHTPSVNGEIVVDIKNMLVTAPCYMLDATVMDIAKETDLVIKELIKLAK